MVLRKDVLGRPMILEVDGHTVEFNRQDAYGLVLAYCYHEDEPCQANQAGLCKHALQALFEAARVTVTVFNHQANAEDLAERVSARVYTLRSGQSNGGGLRWVVAKAN